MTAEKECDVRTNEDEEFVAYLRTGQVKGDLAGAKARAAPVGFRKRLDEQVKAFGGVARVALEITTAGWPPLPWPTDDDTANLGAYRYTSSGAGSNLPLRVSVDLLQDAQFDFAALVARRLGERIAREQAPHWVTGTGVGQPLGIAAATLTADNTLDVADTIGYGDIMATYDLLDAAYEPNARWLFRKNTWSQIRGIVDTFGRPVAQDSPTKTLLGFPVIFDQAVPAMSLLFGDFREAYVIRRVSSLTVVVNPYSTAANGEIEYTASARAGGTIQNRSAYVITAPADFEAVES